MLEAGLSDQPAPETRKRPPARPVNSGMESAREVRTRLSETPRYAPEFEYDQLMMFVNNELAASISVPMLATIVALVLALWSPWTPVLFWLAAVLVGKGMLLLFCKQFKSQPREQANVRTWRNRLSVAEFFHGVTWAAAAPLAAESAATEAHIFIFAALIVVLAVRVMFGSTVMQIVYCGTVPITVTLMLRFAFLNDSLYWAMAGIAVCVHVYFMFMAHGLNSTVLSMLEFRAEKDQLIADIEAEKSISDEARARAEAANVAKSRFLATMSHELRTPLNAILGFSEVMRDEVLGELNNPLYKEYSSNIHESGAHLLKLINEILDISRIEAGRYELSEENIRLVEIAEDCHRLLKLKLEGKKLNLIQSFDTTLGSVWADERAIRQVFLNLMSNAIKFTPHGGTIEVSIQPMPDGGQMLSVRDSGPGIPEEEIPRVLQPFGQGSLAHETAEGGTGLGLPIVQKLVALHGGEFSLRSELRKGTEVSITLPAKRVARMMPPLQPLGEERHRKNPLVKPEPPVEPSAPRETAASKTEQIRSRLRQSHLKRSA